MLHHMATAVHVTGSVTIECRAFLGAQSTTGTMTVDRGGALDATKRICTVAAGADFMPNFPVHVEDEDAESQQRSRIRVQGSTDGIVLISP